MFNKRNKVYYTINKFKNLDEVTSEEWLNLWTDYPSMKSCEWFKSMPQKVGKKTKLNHAQAAILSLRQKLNPFDNHSHNTVRACPGIKNVLMNSMLIKSPCDIDVAITDEIGEYGTGLPLGNDGKKPYAAMLYFSDDRLRESINMHPTSQWTSEKSNILKGYINLKINTGIKLHCKNNDPIFIQPTFHNPAAPWIVIPGAFDSSNRTSVSLIFNVFIKEDTKPFSIKAGDALFYVYFNTPIKLIKLDKVPTGVFKKFFNHAGKPLTKNI